MYRENEIDSLKWTFTNFSMEEQIEEISRDGFIDNEYQDVIKSIMVEFYSLLLLESIDGEYDNNNYQKYYWHKQEIKQEIIEYQKVLICLVQLKCVLFEKYHKLLSLKIYLERKYSQYDMVRLIDNIDEFIDVINLINSDSLLWQYKNIRDEFDNIVYFLLDYRYDRNKRNYQKLYEDCEKILDEAIISIQKSFIGTRQELRRNRRNNEPILHCMITLAINPSAFNYKIEELLYRLRTYVETNSYGKKLITEYLNNTKCIAISVQNETAFIAFSGCKKDFVEKYQNHLKNLCDGIVIGDAKIRNTEIVYDYQEIRYYLEDRERYVTYAECKGLDFYKKMPPMFSCAERKLLSYFGYNSIFSLYVLKKPCYMCERALNSTHLSALDIITIFPDTEQPSRYKAEYEYLAEATYKILHEKELDKDSSNLLDEIFTGNGSKQVKTNVAVYFLSQKYYERGETEYLKKAISDVIEYTKVKPSTVLDKLYRQNEMSSKEYMSKIIENIEIK